MLHFNPPLMKLPLECWPPLTAFPLFSIKGILILTRYSSQSSSAFYNNSLKGIMFPPGQVHPAPPHMSTAVQSPVFQQPWRCSSVKRSPRSITSDGACLGCHGSSRIDSVSQPPCLVSGSGAEPLSLSWLLCADSLPAGSSHALQSTGWVLSSHRWRVGSCTVASVVSYPASN